MPKKSVKTAAAKRKVVSTPVRKISPSSVSVKRSASGSRKKSWNSPVGLLLLAGFTVALLTFALFYVSQQIQRTESLSETEVNAAVEKLFTCQDDLRATFDSPLRDGNRWFFGGTQKNGITTRNGLLLIKVKNQGKTDRNFADLEFNKKVRGDFVVQTVLMDLSREGAKDGGTSFPYLLNTYSDNSSLMVRVDEKKEDKKYWEVQPIFKTSGSDRWQNGKTMKFDRNMPIKLRVVREGSKVTVMAKKVDNGLTDMSELASFTVADNVLSQVALGADSYRNEADPKHQITAKFKNLRIFCADVLNGNLRADAE